MHRVKQLIGLPVLDLASGKRIASVRSLLIDPESCQLVALILQKSGLLSDGKAVRISRVHAIGSDAVVLPEGEEPVSLASIVDDLPQAVGEDRLTGRQVLTENGRMLGTLIDLAFEPGSGRITQFILSDGLLQNLMGGYSTIVSPTQAVIGEENIIVSETAEGQLEPEVLGLTQEPPQGR